MTIDTPDLPEELLSAYLDDECDAAERAAVQARLAVDPEWRAILEEVAAARAAVRGLPMREPPAGFFEHLERLERAEHKPWSRAARALSAVAAAAAVVVGFVLAAPSSPRHDVTPAIATLADAHAATESLATDPISALAPLAVTVDSLP